MHCLGASSVPAPPRTPSNLKLSSEWPTLNIRSCLVRGQIIALASNKDKFYHIVYVNRKLCIYVNNQCSVLCLQLDFSGKGPKDKIPWITLNNEDYADSELIVQMLQKKYNKFLTGNVTKADEAVALAMRIMLEEHFNWSVY